MRCEAILGQAQTGGFGGAQYVPHVQPGLLLAPAIRTDLQVLLELDQSLKSQPVAAQTLLETALCRLALAGSGR